MADGVLLLPPAAPSQEELDAQLLAAIDNKNPVDAIRLLEQGANPNSVDEDSSSLLLLMASVTIFKDALLLGMKKGGDVNYVDKDGKTPFWYACQYHDVDVIKEMIRRGADIRRDGDEIFYYASQNKHPRVPWYLLSLDGIDIHAIVDGTSVLRKYIAVGNRKIVKRLIEKGAVGTSINLGIDAPLIYIASQHTGECSWDSYENILCYADKIRHTFLDSFQAWLTDKTFTMLNPPTEEFDSFVATHYFRENGLESTRESIEYIQLMLLRYVRRTLQQRRGSVWRNLLQFTFTNEVTLNAPPTPLIRQPSYNSTAGPTVKTKGSSYLSYLMGSSIDDPTVNETETFIDIIQRFSSSISSRIQIVRKNLLTDSESIRLKDHCVAIYMIIRINNHGIGHVLTILRNNDIWYLCDNNIGIARPILKEHADMCIASLSKASSASHHFRVISPPIGQPASSSYSINGVLIHTEPGLNLWNTTWTTENNQCFLLYDVDSAPYPTEKNVTTGNTVVVGNSSTPIIIPIPTQYPRVSISRTIMNNEEICFNDRFRGGCSSYLKYRTYCPYCNRCSTRDLAKLHPNTLNLIKSGIKEIKAECLFEKKLGFCFFYIKGEPCPCDPTLVDPTPTTTSKDMHPISERLKSRGIKSNKLECPIEKKYGCCPEFADKYADTLRECHGILEDEDYRLYLNSLDTVTGRMPFRDIQSMLSSIHYFTSTMASPVCKAALKNITKRPHWVPPPLSIRREYQTTRERYGMDEDVENVNLYPSIMARPLKKHRTRRKTSKRNRTRKALY